MSPNSSTVTVEHLGHVKRDQTINLQCNMHRNGCTRLTGVCNADAAMTPLSVAYIILWPAFLLTPLLPLKFTSPLQQISVAFPPVYCIIHSHVHGLSPISRLINKTYLCACSLTSPSSRLVPEAKLWDHVELIKQHRWMAFSNCEKMTTIQAIARLRELCL